MTVKTNPNAPVVRKDLDEAVETILEGMDNLLNDPESEMQKKFKNVDNRFDLLETKINNVERHLKDEIGGLKADLSNTVTKKEFNQLKTKVDKYIPVS